MSSITVELDGLFFDMEAPDNPLPAGKGGLAAASGIGEDGLSGSEVDRAAKAPQSFGKAVDILSAVSARFAKAFEGRKIGEAEIEIGLKVSAKGDFILVGSSGEATIKLKLKLPAG